MLKTQSPQANGAEDVVSDLGDYQNGLAPDEAVNGWSQSDQTGYPRCHAQAP